MTPAQELLDALNQKAAQVQNFERTIRRTLKAFKDKARKARSDAREYARHRNYEKSTSFEAMAVAYDAAASILVQDYSFLKVMKK